MKISFLQSSFIYDLSNFKGRRLISYSHYNTLIAYLLRFETIKFGMLELVLVVRRSQLRSFEHFGSNSSVFKFRIFAFIGVKQTKYKI